LGRRIRCTPPLKNAYQVGYPTATADRAHYANADPEQQPAFVGRFTQPLLAADTQTALVAFAVARRDEFSVSEKPTAC